MADPKAAETFPKIYENVNVPAQIVYTPEQEAQLGDAWVELDLASQGLAITPTP
jgi:hypothetical protein